MTSGIVGYCLSNKCFGNSSRRQRALKNRSLLKIRAQRRHNRIDWITWSAITRIWKTPNSLVMIYIAVMTALSRLANTCEAIVSVLVHCRDSTAGLPTGASPQSPCGDRTSAPSTESVTYCLAYSGLLSSLTMQSDV